jgi:hypothetical protein
VLAENADVTWGALDKISKAMDARPAHLQQQHRQASTHTSTPILDVPVMQA